MSVPQTSREFSHRPFSHDKASTHIRVIQIKPECGEPIRCVMKQMERPTSRSESFYSCLSYTWDPKEPGRPIYIEGEDINEGVKTVTKNLGDFLGAARDANVTDWLWIDALCINQGDVPEIEQQVKKMGQTYDQAKKVFIWLSELIDKPTIHALEKIVGDVEEACRARGPGPHDRLELNTPEEVWLEPLSNILNARYWTRLWIGQEFILAGDPTLFFGNFQTGAHNIALFIGSVGGTDGLHDLPGWQYFWWRYMRFEDRHAGRPPEDESLSLASLLRAFAEKDCQDKRDRVYGLLSLADDADPALVDYNDKFKVDDVFRNTMALMMRERRPLDELLLIGEALIESLELWPATDLSSTDLSSTDLSSSPLDIKFDDTKDVTIPTWGYATLETWEEVPSTVHETIQAACMYVGIRDGPDLHVFEYAVERTTESCDGSELQYFVARKANRPIVKCCRAHEYLRGRSPACVGPISQDGLPFFWLESIPSEAVHYFSNSDAGGLRLRSWNARGFQFSGETADEPAQHPDRLILPARRIVNSRRSSENIAWWGYITHRKPLPFATVDMVRALQSRDYQLNAQPPPLAQGHRSTTMCLPDDGEAYESRMAEYSGSEEFDEEEWDGEGMEVD